MKNIKNILFSALLVPVFAVAQKPAGGGVEQNQDVIKNFDARLIDAEKVKTTPYLPSIDTSTKAQNYNVPTRSVNVAYLPPKLRPIAMKPEGVPEAYNGYAKLGYGLPNSPYAELGYHLTQDKSYNIDLHLKHHSADNAAIANQRFSNTEGDLSGSFFAPNGMAIDGKLGYGTNAKYLYGYDHLKDTFESAVAKQNFNLFKAGAKLYNSLKTEADFSYAAGFDYYRLSDNFASIESDFDVRLEGTKWFADKHPFNLQIRADLNSLDTANTAKTQNLTTIYIKPNFTYHADAFKIKLGANIANYNDNYYPMPDIEATANLAGAQLTLFAGWKGDVIKNSFKNISDYNPYVKSRFLAKNTQKIEYFGGIKGSLSALQYQLQAGYSTNNDLALFLSDPNEKFKRFNILYDTVNIVNIRGTVIYKPIKALELTGTISQNAYSLKKEDRAWGLPSLDVNVLAKYWAIPDVANIKANLFVQNGVNVKDPTLVSATNLTGATRLDGLLDLNVGAEYWFSKNIGAFLDLNNVLNFKRERWLNYPGFGFNFLGGITARF
jgi:hypothetical protein